MKIRAATALRFFPVGFPADERPAWKSASLAYEEILLLN
jgi:hypothetical protein